MSSINRFRFTLVIKVLFLVSFLLVIIKLSKVNEGFFFLLFIWFAVSNVVRFSFFCPFCNKDISFREALKLAFKTRCRKCISEKHN